VAGCTVSNKNRANDGTDVDQNGLLSVQNTGQNTDHVIHEEMRAGVSAIQQEIKVAIN
jgi:hypothetical protein